MTNIEKISIQPGQLYVARNPMILQTILGSCVSATFWCGRFAIGALCHGVLPKCPRGTTSAEGHRYVDSSIRYLLEQFDALGVRRQELEVKLFGGADVLPVASRSVPKLTIGAQNCQAALEVMAQEGMRVLASDLGGTRGRTIHFHTGTGEVLARRLARLAVPDAPEIDSRLRSRDQRLRL